MKNKINISDFSFIHSGSGHYKVSYTSPVTGRVWSTTTDNMHLIDATNGEEKPKIKDLNKLKKLCKK